MTTHEPVAIGNDLRRWIVAGIILFANVVQTAVIVAQDATAPVAPPSPAVKPDESAPVAISTTIAAKQQLILVIGAPGTEDYREAFSTWAARWKDAATRGNADCNVIGLDAPVESDTPTAPQMSDLQKLLDAIAAAAREKSDEPLWIVFLGHGTFDGRTASWNLNGPDITAEQLAERCQNLQRPLAVVACASCTAPFVNALSGENRVVVTATRDGNQIQYSRFGDAMSQAIGSLDADIDRDGQTSLMEAWLFASRRTAEFYKLDGRLATEHSLLDDNGDGQGVRSEIFDGDRVAENIQNPDQVDGRLATRWHLLRSDEEQKLTSEQRALRDQLEAEIELLRRKKNELPEAEYLSQLEQLLLPLAKLYQSLEKRPAP